MRLKHGVAVVIRVGPVAGLVARKIRMSVEGGRRGGTRRSALDGTIKEAGGGRRGTYS